MKICLLKGVDMDFKKHIEDNCKIITKAHDVKYVSINAIAHMLQYDYALRYAIFRSVERFNHKCDVEQYLDDNNLPRVDEQTLSNIIDSYEDYLSEDDSWLDCLHYAFDSNGVKTDEC